MVDVVGMVHKIISLLHDILKSFFFFCLSLLVKIFKNNIMNFIVEYYGRDIILYVSYEML